MLPRSRGWGGRSGLMDHRVGLGRETLPYDTVTVDTLYELIQTHRLCIVEGEL